MAPSKWMEQEAKCVRNACVMELPNSHEKATALVITFTTMMVEYEFYMWEWCG